MEDASIDTEDFPEGEYGEADGKGTRGKSRETLRQPLKRLLGGLSVADTSMTERQAAAVRLLALRDELRNAREHRRQYRLLRAAIDSWDLDRVQAALTWHKLEETIGSGQGLDKWELGMLHDARREHDGAARAAIRVMKHSTSKSARKQAQAQLYRLAHAQTYVSPCRLPEQVQRDIQAVQRKVDPLTHARRLKRKAKERKAERDASGETARRAQARADIEEVYAKWRRGLPLLVRD